MMNDLAARLIHDLRYDSGAREHFYMGFWHGRSCNTVGCIAGTAIYMSAGDDYLHLRSFDRLCAIARDRGASYEEIGGVPDGWHVTEGARLLGIPFEKTASHLFSPWSQGLYLRATPADVFDYLPEQARPALDTVEKMIAWAKVHLFDVDSSMRRQLTPDRCAFALERIVRDEIPYCNWAEAFDACPV